MAQQLAGFPKELESHFTDRLDKLYLASFWTNLLIWFSLFAYLQSLPPKEISEEDLKKYMSAIYAVEVKKEVVQVAEIAQTDAVGRKVEAEDIVTETAEQKAERRAAQRERRAAQMAAAREAARQHGIFAAAGAMGSGTRGSRGKRATKGLSGGLGGVDVGKLRGMATTGADVAAIEKLRGGGAITEGGGDIDVTQLSLKDIKAILDQSVVEIDDIPEVKGTGGSATANRKPNDILAVIQRESSKLKNCYNTQKKKDPNLKGKIVIEYTILADGSVQRVKIKGSEWSNPAMGKKVESCCKKRVARWRFGQANGDDTTSFTLKFI